MNEMKGKKGWELQATAVNKMEMRSGKKKKNTITSRITPRQSCREKVSNVDLHSVITNSAVANLFFVFFFFILGDLHLFSTGASSLNEASCGGTAQSPGEY